MSVGAVVGRFQVATLTEGHRLLLDTVCANHDQVLILVGEAPTQPNPRNPLPFYVRRDMLQEAYPQAMILPIMDCMEDAAWSANLDALIRAAVGFQSVTLYAGRDSFVPHYFGHYPVEELVHIAGTCGTDQRNELRESTDNSYEFRAGMIHAVMNRFRDVYPTVDMAAVRNGEVLVGRKAGEQQWRLPGGHVDPSDYSLEVAANREFREECGVTPATVQYIASRKVDDWRTRYTGNGVMTALFLCTLGDAEPVAGDDLAELRWLPLTLRLAEIKETFVPDHVELYMTLQEYLGTA